LETVLASSADERPGTLDMIEASPAGVGPSHQAIIEDMLGLSYETPGRNTDEYVQILAALLRGEQVNFAGKEFRVILRHPTCWKDRFPSS
jgi:luciferase-like monooxygenase